MSRLTAQAPTLTTGQHVVFRHVVVGALPAVVERMEADAAVIALTVADDGVPRLVGEAVAIEATSPRGIHRYTGRLASERGGQLAIALDGTVERIQRREFVRVSAYVDVTVRGLNTPIGGDTTTIDVSAAGIQILDRWALPIDLDVDVEIRLPDGPPLRTVGRVVRAGGDGSQKGIRLDPMVRSDEERLMRYIREREVQAMRAAKGR
jgi:hypothetical protein